MNGVFSVLSDAQAGMFRLQQTRKPWEKDSEAKDAQGQLAQKAERAAGAFQLTPRQLRDHASAKAALEEAIRVGGPKASAEQRMERVERKIDELKLAMRFARGDPEKLARLAHEAALLCKEAGRAAKEYGTGIANAAEMGLGGGAGTAGSTETTRTTTVTTLTVQQTEVSVSLTVKLGSGDADAGGDAGASADVNAEAGAAGAAQLAADLASGEAAASAPSPEGELPPELARMVDGALSGLRDGEGLAGGGRAGKFSQALIQSLIADNDRKMSRFKEADGFGRRVEAVLHVAKQVLGEAKVANMADESEERRKERRERFKADDKLVDGAQKEVNALRQAAFGSGVAITDALGLSDDTAGGDETGEMTVDAVAADGVETGPQAVNMLA
ncbi:hypothetical protein [Azospirillum doebereinerae]|uniref:hypothetical protein n=1 Tax=Azospirillum doebereinerae TaxID=92933 RepID=UPI00163BADA4|nr:hypothetical protein [Azospirillum doebereinerae]